MIKNAQKCVQNTHNMTKHAKHYSNNPKMNKSARKLDTKLQKDQKMAKTAKRT